jgi:hypothetical protein
MVTACVVVLVLESAFVSPLPTWIHHKEGIFSTCDYDRRCSIYMPSSSTLQKYKNIYIHMTFWFVPLLGSTQQLNVRIPNQR